MADMTSRVKKGGVYGFSLSTGEKIEGTAQNHSIERDPIRLHVTGTEGTVYVNPDHIAFMWVIDESGAEQRNFDY